MENMIDESGQHPNPFAKFLMKRGICTQYTNQALMDMVRNKLSNSFFFILSLWMYVFKKIDMYLLNKVPSKVVQKTHFELLTDM